MDKVSVIETWPGAAEDVPVPPGSYRRTGPYAAELDGTVFALHESPGEGGRTVGTLLFALRYVAGDALRGAGIETTDDFRAWLVGGITDDVVSGSRTPQPTGAGTLR